MLGKEEGKKRFLLIDNFIVDTENTIISIEMLEVNLASLQGKKKQHTKLK